MATIIDVMEAVAALPGVLEIDSPEEFDDGGVCVNVTVEQTEDGWWALACLDDMIHVSCDCPDGTHREVEGDGFPPAVTLTVMWVEQDTSTFAMNLDPGIDLDECLYNIAAALQYRSDECPACRDEQFAEIEAFLASQGPRE